MTEGVSTTWSADKGEARRGRRTREKIEGKGIKGRESQMKRER